MNQLRIGHKSGWWLAEAMTSSHPGRRAGLVSWSETLNRVLTAWIFGTVPSFRDQASKEVSPRLRVIS